MLIINNDYILNLRAGFVEDVKSGQKTMLGGNEISLLQYMVEHPHRPLPKSELLEQVWHSKGVIVEESSLLHCVSTCRKTLRDRNGELISTIRGVGYQFNGEVKPYQPDQSVVEESNPMSVGNNASDSTVLFFKSPARYALLFSLSAGLAYWLASSFRSPWVEAEYSELHYQRCTLETKQPITLDNVRAFDSGNQMILVDQQGMSVTYQKGEVEVNCE
ncbi:winged helix-turn-helix domain-containing protein [Vibrio ostreicida]|uniref:winged helix-turn-helix domain-containing protein n=1 Tax=Vibrio ostreicida TaxID=526588 RepID=UPI003B59AC0F